MGLRKQPIDGASDSLTKLHLGIFVLESGFCYVHFLLHLLQCDAFLNATSTVPTVYKRGKFWNRKYRAIFVSKTKNRDA